MKKVKWMDVIIATPMVLTLSTFGGSQGLFIAAPLLTILAVILRWGNSYKSLEQKAVTSPVRVN